MAYFFIAGIICGCSLALLLLGGKMMSYRKNLLISKSQVEQLEKHNNDLQLQLLEKARDRRQEAAVEERLEKLRDVA